MSSFIIGIFVLLALANFGLQIYVALKISKNPFMALRGTRVFIRGWQQAEALGIKDIMQVWSGVLLLLILMVCPVAIVGALNFGEDDANSDQSNNPRPVGTQPIQARNWGITSPTAEQTIARGEANEPIEIRGWVRFDRREVERYFLQICTDVFTENGVAVVGNCGNFGEFELTDFYTPQPEENSLLGYLRPSTYDPGRYYLGIGYRLRGDAQFVYTYPLDQMIAVTIVR